MKRTSGGKIWLVDIAGGVAVASALGAAAWLALVQGRDASLELARTSAEVATSRRNLAGLRAVAEAQKGLLAAKKEQLAKAGHLPDETPTEEYFEYLSTLATQHSLRILRHNPVPSQEYPGLREHRFAFDVAGAFPDLVAFFHDVEASNYWADVSYLRVAAIGQDPGAADQRIANLTFSLFSAQHESPKVEPG